jgi:hypothetical protein
LVPIFSFLLVRGFNINAGCAGSVSVMIYDYQYWLYRGGYLINF